MAKKQVTKTIETSTTMKQIYRHYFINYIIKDDVDGMESLYKIARHLISDKKINTLKKDFGENYDKIMKRFNSFIRSYQLAQQYRLIIGETPDKKIREEYDKKLRELCMALPVINNAVILVFTALVKNTDLKNIPIQSPTTRDSLDNRMPISLAQDDRVNI